MHPTLSAELRSPANLANEPCAPFCGLPQVTACYAPLASGMSTHFISEAARSVAFFVAVGFAAFSACAPKSTAREKMDKTATPSRNMFCFIGKLVSARV